MKAAFTLTPAESRRLIAKAVAQMDEVQRALKIAYVIMCGGTTNGFVAREILGRTDIEPQRYTAGTNTNRLLCVTNPEDRINPIILHKGKAVEISIQDALADFHINTVVIKGANAVDPEGNVGVCTSGFDGGTIAATIGTVTSQGLRYIVPVGLEKLVPSVLDSALYTGAKTLDYTLGADFGMYCLSGAKVVTEIQALHILAGVEAKHVASGGIGGSEGSVVLVALGEAAQVGKAIEIVEAIKGEPPVKALKGTCEACEYACKFHGMKEEDLPDWLRSG